MLKKTLLIYVLLAVNGTVWADETKPFEYSVSIIVSADDSLKPLIESYVARELRSLGDVVVVESDPTFTLHLAARDVRSGGDNIGIVFTTIVLLQFKNSILTNMLQPQFKDIGLSLTNGLEDFWSFWLLTGSRSDLQELCKLSVANFDTKVLNDFRKRPPSK